MNYLEKHLMRKLKVVGAVDMDSVKRMMLHEVESIDSVVERLAEKGKVRVEGGVVKVLAQVEATKVEALSKSWLGYRRDTDHEEVARRAKIAPICLASLYMPTRDETDTWWEVFGVLSDQGVLVDAEDPYLSSPRAKSFKVYKGCPTKAPLEAVDHLIVVAASLEEITPSQLTGVGFTLARINDRMKRLEADGLLMRTGSTKGHRGKYHPRWYRATDKLFDELMDDI